MSGGRRSKGQEQQQAATNEAADKPRSTASGEQEEAASGPKTRILRLKEKTSQRAREETA